ncbi:MAG: GreA/GreB family elongation factor, partial [Firmicutes bacterium]|nr:GreA/GreB family elongation factor [Bacillota bacterium]
KDLATGEILEYTIVGSTEADPFEGRISNQSLVGQSLLGKKIGEVAEVQAIDGLIKYEVLDITR